jgi:hypothetical protein
MLFYRHKEMNVAKKRITVSIDEEVADFLYSMPNTSAVVSEAVREYRARLLEKELESAYIDDREESAELNQLWGPADAEVEE